MRRAACAQLVVSTMSKRIRGLGSKACSKTISLPAQVASDEMHAATPSASGHVLLAYERLLPATLSARYKRFLGDATLEGDAGLTVVHVPNTGPMTGLIEHLPCPVLLSKSANLARKYVHTLEWVQPRAGAAWVGVHSAKANAMVAQLLSLRAIPELLPYGAVRAEVKYGENSRVDFVLERLSSLGSSDSSEAAAGAKRAKQCYVEVKSVTLAEDGDDGKRVALFPDTTSIRGQRHLRELTAIAQGLHCDAALLFLVQRGDCHAFAPCHDKDPEYGRLLVEAAAAGVQVLAVCCELDAAAGVVRSRRALPVWLHYKMSGNLEAPDV